MRVSYGKTMVGPIESATAQMPYVRPPLPHRRGMLLGLEDRFRTVVWIDPHGSKVEERTFSPRYAVEGQVEVGKSALAKQLIRQASRLKATDDGITPVVARLLIHDRKMGEYEAVTSHLRCRPIRYHPGHRFNPLGFPMGVDHMTDILIELAERANRGPLKRYSPLAISIAVEKMCRTTRIVSIERAADTCMGLTADDLRAYFNIAHILPEVTSTDGDDEVSSMADRLQNRLGEFQSIERVGTINLNEFLDDAGHSAAALRTVTGGMFGGAIGGEQESYLDFMQPVSTIRWDDSSPRAIDVVGSIHHRWRTIAKNSIENPELIQFIPHFDFGDEEHKAKSAMHLRFESEAARETRAFHTASFRITQYSDTDDRIGGGDDPTTQAYVEGIRNATGGRIVFKMPDSDPVREYLIKTGFTELEAEQIIAMPKRRAAFKLPGRPTIFVNTVLGKSDRELSYSNAETDKMTAIRTSAHDDPEFAARLAVIEGRPIPSQE